MALTTTVADPITERPEAPARPPLDERPLADAKGSRSQPEKTGREEAPTGGRRGGRKRSSTRTGKTAGVARYFLTKSLKDGTPELDRELSDENQAMIEALRLDRTFVVVTEWRSKVDCSVQGKPVIQKEAVSRSAQ
jgi:hypothetical protein